jgi:hypothetical protein
MASETPSRTDCFTPWRIQRNKLKSIADNSIQFG